MSGHAGGGTFGLPETRIAVTVFSPNASSIRGMELYLETDEAEVGGPQRLTFEQSQGCAHQHEGAMGYL